MQGKTTYESSYEEIKRIRKSMSSDKLTINFDKLDDETKGVVRSALSQALSKREKEVIAVISSN